MIRGIGIDTVEIARFKDWHTHSRTSLERVLSAEEIDYCLSCPAKSAERFAARFAAREAMLKALGSAYPEFKIPLLTLCRHIIIKKTSHGSPFIKARWQVLLPHTPVPECHISLSHTQNVATALIILESSKTLI